MISDGRRYVAVLSTTNRLIVLDTRTGKRRKLDAPGCRPQDGSFGRILLLCTKYETAELDLPKTGRIQPLAFDPRGYVTQIGRHWAHGNINDGSSFGADAYVNLTTGELRTERRTTTGSFRRSLDLPTLPLVKAPPRDSRPAGSDGDETLFAASRVLTLRRGSRTTRPLRGTDFCAYPQIAAGTLTWVDGATVLAASLSGRAPRRWTFMPVNSGRQPSGVLAVHTKDAIVAAVLTDVKADDTPI